MFTNSNDALSLDQPWMKQWPSSGLEWVQRCPVCSELERENLHSDLVDSVFKVAPGYWALWRCVKCRSAYLDPRPTQSTIHQAYLNYYTHVEPVSKSNYASLSPLRKLRRRLVNGYTNKRYCTNATPSLSLGFFVCSAIPSLTKSLGLEYRHIRKISKSGGKLLDVGCGDGSFLRIARNCGWEAVGVDPDQNAVSNAAKQGLIVHHGGIEFFEHSNELFDVITLCHVIEHVFNPEKDLKLCFALLKPGGMLWLETPNIDSFGYARYKKDWRGLEAPRHLVLFNRHSLNLALNKVGFSSLQDRSRPSTSAWMFRASFAIKQGETALIPITLKFQYKIAEILERFFPSRREVLTVTALKPLN